MIAVLGEDGGGDVDFHELVFRWSAFSIKGNKEDKLWFAIKIYDIDRDGFISNGELFIILKMTGGNNLKDWRLQQVCSQLVQHSPLLFPRLKNPNNLSQKGLPLIYISLSSPLDRG